ncbi:hypothetical protein CSC02_0030 [Enterobacter hormaechei subsp. hoffmannii]|nr:hypothetical protein CSC02_0030 [Enterobacter hormaechei subsp. hoffmannii]
MHIPPAVFLSIALVFTKIKSHQIHTLSINQRFINTGGIAIY